MQAGIFSNKPNIPKTRCPNTPTINSKANKMLIYT